MRAWIDVLMVPLLPVLASFAMLVLLAISDARAAEFPPAAAQKYRGDLTRAAHAVWGLDAPIATFAAQVHQESGWRPFAVSRVGAQGLAQFMPATADWLGGIVPELAARQPDNPVWALRALATYDRWLWDRIKAETDCDRMAMVLSAYNGGLGWLIRDKNATAKVPGGNRNLWWGHVELFNAGRSRASFAENRGYPVRILRIIQPAYAAWGAGVCL